jgi:fatty-acyl-CoA synthase
MRNPYNIGLDKNLANFQPLTPLSLLARTAAVYPHLTSTLYDGRSFTWAETYDRCRKLASCLVALGIGEGDTVAAMLPNVPAMHELHFAVPMAGAVLNTLNLRLDAASLAFQLDHGSATVVFVDPQFSGLIAEAIALTTGPKPFIIDVDDPAFADGGRIGQTEYESALAQGDPQFLPRLPRGRMERHCAQLHIGHDRHPEGCRHPSSRCVSQRHQQYSGSQPRTASSLPVDPTDVSEHARKALGAEIWGAE